MCCEPVDCITEIFQCEDVNQCLLRTDEHVCPLHRSSVTQCHACLRMLFRIWQSNDRYWCMSSFCNLDSQGDRKYPQDHEIPVVRQQLHHFCVSVWLLLNFYWVLNSMTTTDWYHDYDGMTTKMIVCSILGYHEVTNQRKGQPVSIHTWPPFQKAYKICAIHLLLVKSLIKDQFFLSAMSHTDMTHQITIKSALLFRLGIIPIRYR